MVDACHLSDDVEHIAGARRRPAGTGGVESGVSKRSVDESGKNLWGGHQSRVLFEERHLVRRAGRKRGV